MLCVLAAGTAWAQGKMPGDMEMHHRLARGVKLEVQNDPAAQVLTVREGPLNLPAHTDHRMAAQPPNEFFAIPFDGWLVAYHPRMVDAQGRELPGRLLHHTAFWNTARSDWLCPRFQEHIFGAGGEMSDWPAVPGYGYRVGAGTRIRVSTMVNNPTDTSYRDAYLEVRIEYRRAAADAPQLTNAYPTWIDVKECDPESAYDVPPGKSAKTGAFTAHDSGILLGVGGHLHDYGREVVLVNRTRKETVATIDARVDAAGRLLAIPVVPFFDRGGYRVDRGDVLQVTAAYDNPTGKVLPEGAMGIVVGYFVPDSGKRMATLRRDRKREKVAKGN